MAKYKFSLSSRLKLATCHKDIQLIMTEAIKVSPLDFGIAEGHRSTTKQKYLYDKGFSKIDGIRKKGQHNYKPSRAVDIFPWTKDKDGNFGINYNQRKSVKQVETEFALIIGCILSTAERLLQEGKIKHRLVSGADWDRDELFALDHNFIDWPHLELRKI